MTAELERFLRGRHCDHDWYIEAHGHFRDMDFICRCGECEAVVRITYYEATNCRTEAELQAYVKNKLRTFEAGNVRRLGLSVPTLLPTFSGQRHGATE